MDNYNMIFNAITLAAGIYCLYVWFKLKKAGKLFENQLLVPKDSKPADCLDEAGYIRFIAPCLLILGLVCVLTGVLCIVDMEYQIISNLFPQVENFNSKLDLGCNILTMIMLILYMIRWGKGRKEYWV